MKMLGSFFAGAFAGFLLGSTKQGCAMRKDFDKALTGFFGAEPAITEGADKNSQEPPKRTSKIRLRKEGTEGTSEESAETGTKSPEQKLNHKESPETVAVDMPADSRPLGIDKAHELAEKLGAKVVEISGEESLPHSHHIDIATSKLSA
jgi:hypothetical protein